MWMCVSVCVHSLYVTYVCRCCRYVCVWLAFDVLFAAMLVRTLLMLTPHSPIYLVTFCQAGLYLNLWSRDVFLQMYFAEQVAFQDGYYSKSLCFSWGVVLKISLF